MKIVCGHNLPALFTLASLLSFSAAASATTAQNNKLPRDEGFVLFSDIPNENHWGLGLGIAFSKSPYIGADSDISPFPVAYFDNKWMNLSGNSFDVKIGKWDNAKISLHTEYALGDGYEESDSWILNDMKKRKPGLWIGPKIEWNTDMVTITTQYLLAGNKGQKAVLGLNKEFSFGEFVFSPHTEVEWLSNKYVEYYYGVRDSEARPWRDKYEGTSTYRVSGGLRVDYAFTSNQKISFDVGVSHSGSGVSHSPLVDNSTIPEVKLGYFYRFN